MVATVSGHQMLSFANQKTVALPSFNTSGGPGTVVVILLATPSNPASAAAALTSGSVSPAVVSTVIDNQNNSYQRILRNSQLGYLYNIPNAVIDVFAANESSIVAAGSTQSLAITLNFAQFTTGIVEAIFIQPALALDSIAQDPNLQNYNVGVTSSGQQPSLTLNTSAANELIIGCIATLTNSPSGLQQPSLASASPNVSVVDAGVIQDTGPSSITNGILVMGLIVYTYLQPAAGSLTLNQILNPVLNPQVAWVELGIGLYESTSANMLTPVVALNAYVMQPGSFTTLTAGGLISGQTVPGPTGPIIKLPLGT